MRVSDNQAMGAIHHSSPITHHPFAVIAPKEQR